MARLQILELPEGSGDDRPPFVLVVDQWTNPFHGQAQQWAEQIGAQGVLVSEKTMEIPANHVPQEEILYAQGKVTRALRDADEPETDGPKCRYCGVDCSDGRSWDGGDLYACPSCADWRAKLNQHKAALLDALGMDRTRDWDDIRNAAAALRKERDAQVETLERVRNLPEQPDVMDAQHPDPTGYLHGYGVAIREAKRATWREIAVDNAADVVAEHDPSRRA
jgi:hypothetical protein